MSLGLKLRLGRLAALALVCALALAGCGRKGGLDLPPNALAGAPPAAGAAPPGAGPELGPDGRPLPPLPPNVTRRRTPLDFLID